MFCASFQACAVRDAALGFARRDVALNTWETPNGLESSEDRGSAGGHGNQHVRLRFAQVRHLTNLPRLQWRTPLKPWQCSAALRALSLFSSIKSIFRP
jgi:hypothetical protein